MRGLCHGIGQPSEPNLSGFQGFSQEEYSTRFAARTKRTVEVNETVSEEVTLEDWQKRLLYVRLIEGAPA